MDIHHAIAIDTMELFSFMDKQRRTFKFRCCKFVRSYTVIDFRPKVIKPRYSGRAVFHVN